MNETTSKIWIGSSVEISSTVKVCCRMLYFFDDFELLSLSLKVLVDAIPQTTMSVVQLRKALTIIILDDHIVASIDEPILY